MNITQNTSSQMHVFEATIPIPQNIKESQVSKVSDLVEEKKSENLASQISNSNLQKLGEEKEDEARNLELI